MSKAPMGQVTRLSFNIFAKRPSGSLVSSNDKEAWKKYDISKIRQLKHTFIREERVPGRKKRRVSIHLNLWTHANS